METGASLVVSKLKAHNVSTIFGLCGDHTNPLIETCFDAGLRVIDTRDERGAAWMAAGWALATAEPGVVVVSNTPALTNAATALADANASGIPVVCLTGGVALDDRGKGHPGDADQAEIARSFVKWAALAGSPAEAARLTEEALHAARPPLRGRPGVSVLELPMDVQYASGEAEAHSLEDPELASTPHDLDEVRRILGDARRPVVVAGSGCFWSRTGDRLQTFAERARVPVFTVRAARGLISDDHELCFGFLNLMTHAAQLAFGEADVALVLGCELDVLLGGGNFNPECTLIRCDADERAFAVGRPAQLELTFDPASLLDWLLDGAQPLDTEDWVKRLREAADARAEELAARGRIASSPLHPARLVAEVTAKLPRDAIVTVDAGELALWALDAIPARTPSSLHASSTSALGALGMGLPWAIGMKAAHPERPVLALVGDGSFGFTAMELETSARHALPVAAVIGNDGGWGIVRHLQQDLHGRALASDLPVSPYELLAEFAGGVGDRVETPQQLAIAVTNALAAAVPSVVNAIIDPAVRHEAMPLIAAMFAARREDLSD